MKTMILAVFISALSFGAIAGERMSVGGNIGPACEASATEIKLGKIKNGTPSVKANFELHVTCTMGFPYSISQATKGQNNGDLAYSVSKFKQVYPSFEDHSTAKKTEGALLDVVGSGDTQAFSVEVAITGKNGSPIIKTGDFGLYGEILKITPDGIMPITVKQLVSGSVVDYIVTGELKCERRIVINKESWCHNDKPIKTITLTPEETQKITQDHVWFGGYRIRPNDKTNSINPDVAIPQRGKESKDSSLWSIDANKSKAVQKLVF